MFMALIASNLFILLLLAPLSVLSLGLYIQHKMEQHMFKKWEQGDKRTFQSVQ
jgi:hypothetical protein